MSDEFDPLLDELDLEDDADSDDVAVDAKKKRVADEFDFDDEDFTDDEFDSEEFGYGFGSGDDGDF